MRMLRFYRKVNPKEGILGMYITATELDPVVLSLVNEYIELF
jgi:hypothetical protein